MPVAPTSAASWASCSTRFLNLPESSAALNLAQLQAQLLGVLLQRGAIERLLVLEQLVVVLPELALLVRRQRGLRRELGVVVERQRQVLEGDPHLVLVGVLDLLEDRAPPASRTDTGSRRTPPPSPAAVRGPLAGESPTLTSTLAAGAGGAAAAALAAAGAAAAAWAVSFS